MVVVAQTNGVEATAKTSDDLRGVLDLCSFHPTLSLTDSHHPPHLYIHDAHPKSRLQDTSRIYILPRTRIIISPPSSHPHTATMSAPPPPPPMPPGMGRGAGGPPPPPPMPGKAPGGKPNAGAGRVCHNPWLSHLCHLSIFGESLLFSYILTLLISSIGRPPFRHQQRCTTEKGYPDQRPFSTNNRKSLRRPKWTTHWKRSASSRPRKTSRTPFWTCTARAWKQSSKQ